MDNGDVFNFMFPILMLSEACAMANQRHHFVPQWTADVGFAAWCAFLALIMLRKAKEAPHDG